MSTRARRRSEIRFTMPLAAALSGIALLFVTSDVTATGEVGRAPSLSGTATVNSSDFNGDGYADLAVGAPYDDVGGHAGAGVVSVLYGSANGVRPGGSQVWHQDKPGVQDVAEAGDHFGWALATGDFDNDGYADLAIGIPDEDLTVVNGNAVNAGAVQILFGGPDGLTSAGAFLHKTADDATVDSGDQRGYALATLDLWDRIPPEYTTPDGYADLAVGIPGYEDGRGRIEVRPGQCFTPSLGICGLISLGAGSISGQGRAGSSIAAGDFYGSPLDEVAFGAPYADSDGILPAVTDAGLVRIYSPDAAFIDLYQGSPGPETREAGDHFGMALGAGDLNGNGRKDLLVGVPDEDLAGKPNAGLVDVVLFESTGTGTMARTTIDQDSPGVPGARAANARFGASLALANFGKTAVKDVAVGIPGQGLPGAAKAGAVVILYGTPSGPGTSGNQLWDQDSTGIADTAEPNDAFGSALFAANFGKGGVADLGVGVPREGFAGLSNAGAVHVLYGSSTGLTATGSQRWTQSPAIGEPAQAGDRFGWSVQ